LNLSGRIGWLPSWERSGAAFPSVDPSLPFNPLAQGRVWQSRVNSDSVNATSILSKNFVVDGLFAFTKHNVNVFAPEHECAGDFVGIPHACQPPYSLDTEIPIFNVTGWTLNGQSPARDYVDPQWQVEGNAGWTKGSHSIKFGADYINLHQNHYETQAQDFTFNGGSTSLSASGAATANNFNRFADFLLGLPSARSAQAMTPLIGEDASGASQIDNQFRPATLRNWNVGTYVRDQWQINQKITASLGLRWEYYSLPRRKDHGIEVYDFTVNRLLICDVGPNSPDCGITVEKNLFTPRVGVAYRPNELMVIRAGYSRNPQSNNPGRQQLPPSQAFPQTVIITQTAPNNFSSVGSLSEGSPVVPLLDLSSGIVPLPPGAGVNTFRDSYVRGKISSWNVSWQTALSPRMSLNVAYVANRQNGITRNENLNYGQLGGGAASQPFQSIGITSPMNVFSPLGKVKYDSLQVSLNRRLSEGIQFTAAYTFSKTIDWWAAAIPIPQYWDLNKGETGSPHKLNASLIYQLPFGAGRRWLNNGSVLGNVVGGWQVNSFLSYQSGTLVTVSSNTNVLNAPGVTTQFADKVKPGPVEIFGDAGPTAQYFDVSAFKSITEARFGNAGLGAFRGPSAPNLDMSFFRTFAVGRDRSLQLRAELFNVTNTPHFANPASNISNVVFNQDGTIRSLNGVGGITDVVRTGRQYDEREWRLGVRFGF